MKILYLLFIVSFQFQFAFPQAATDAMDLSFYVNRNTGFFKSDSASKRAVGELIKSYLVDLPDSVTFEDIQAAIETNHPLNRNYNPILAPYFNFTSLQGSGLFGGISKAFSSVGNLDVTNFADGIAKFLVERSKQELNIAFFRKFQEFVAQHPEMQLAFPTTSMFLENVYSYKYAAMLPALRSGFHKDFNSITSNLLKLREPSMMNCAGGDSGCISRLSKISSFLNNTPQGTAFVSALIVSDNLIKGNDPAEIMDILANDPVCQDTTKNFSHIIRFSNLISQSLRSEDGSRIWMGKKDLQRLTNDVHATKIYLGLLYASDKNQYNLRFQTPNRLISFKNELLAISGNVERLDSFKIKINAFVQSLENVQKTLNEIRIANFKDIIDEESILRFADFASSVSEMIKGSFQFLQITNLDINIGNLSSELQSFLKIIDPAVDICYDIKSKNYTSLVIHTATILESIFKDEFTFKAGFIKYGTFMASIVEAKNSDEVKSAIESAVLPVGSSSIKRETNFNIALNGFIGPFGGAEYLPKLKQNKTAFVAGISAPVGVAFSWGNLKSREFRNNKKTGGKSISLFIPVIDVGALSAFRLSDDSSNVAAEVQLKNIISPGLYFYYGLGKCPVSIGFGAQIGPQLREIFAKDINLDKNFYVRFGLNVVVDIPFFNLYTKD